MKRVVLYKSGIGYFEHAARVRGNQELGIDFSTAQLNDVLKSLTVVDLTEGRVTGVRYNSIAPVSERLKTLRLPLGDQTTRADFLNALRGARVEVRSGAAVAAGRVMSVEKVRRPSPKSELVMESTELVIVTDAGELRSFDLAPATAVRIAECDLNEYEIKQNVTIGKNQSALVPLLQSRIDAEEVTLWNADSGQPLRALWITNTSGLTLAGGAFNVREEETFAGEGLLDALRPNEKRLISYAADQTVRITVEEDSGEKPVSRVRIAKGLITMTKERRESKTYNIHNWDTAARQIGIEHPARSGWKLAGGLKPEVSSASFHRFRVKVDPGQTAQFAVEEYRAEETQVALTDLSSDEVTLLAEQKRVTPAMEQAVQRILAQKSGLSRLDAQLKARQQDIDTVASDQNCLRENMKALKDSAEEKALARRYIQQWDEEENRLAALRTQMSELKDKRERASQELDQMLLELVLDETF